MTSPEGAPRQGVESGADEHTETLGEATRVQAPLAARITILNARARPATFLLREGSCRIGAGDGVHLLVDDKTISRAHAELELVREGVAVRDLGSRNGTFLYGQRIERATLSLGSRLRFGRVEAEIAADLSPDRLAPYPSDHYGRLRGGSPAMRTVYGLLSRLEGSLATVLITGETGTGKELAARAVHDHSPVARGPFVSVNCGALEKGLARSELFGHARGAFTGAIESRAGAFESAHGGTLFLDEIGELPLDVQPLLLRALEHGQVARIGETQERPVKVRVIAATHRDLSALVSDERFREDLYYRLMVVKVVLPALRDRLEDVPMLVEHFATELGAAPPPPEVMRRFLYGVFRGNVRELRNAVEAYVAVGALNDTPADTLDLSAALRRYIVLEQPYAPQKERLLQLFLDVYVDLLLARTNGNQSEAARISGLERGYLNRVIRRKTT